jgi:predicted Zn-dependent protease
MSGRDTTSPAHQRSTTLGLARHYLGIGQPSRALDILESNADIPLDDPRVWFIRGRSFYDLTEFDRSEDAALSGLACAPEHAGLLAVLGDARVQLGKFADAERAYLDALRQTPGNPSLMCAYAHLTARFGQMSKADSLAAEAARIAPESLQVLQTLVGMAYLRGNDREAARLCRLLLERYPEDAYGHRMLAVTTRSTSSASQMLDRMTVAARLEPTARGTTKFVRDYQVLGLGIFRPLGWVMMGGSARRALLLLVVVTTLFEAYQSTIGLIILVILALYIGFLPSIAHLWLRWRRH